MPSFQKKRSLLREKDPSDGTSNQKFGRTELREVGPKRKKQKAYNKPEESQGQENAEDKVENIEDSEKFEGDTSKAYDALVTLLRAEQEKEGDEKISVHSEQRPKNAQESAVEEDEEEIAGINMEAAEEEIDEDNDESDDDAEQRSDPYEIHFNEVDDQYLEKEQQQALQREKWKLASKDSYDFGLSYTFQTTSDPIETVPQKSTHVNKYSLKKRLIDPYVTKFGGTFTKEDQVLFDPMIRYTDVSFPYENYQRTFYRKLYVLHVLNHTYKTRDRIMKNNEKIRSYQEAVKQGHDTEEPELRDQGFTRPKVLILLPSRNLCYEIVEMLIKLSGTDQQENKKKFRDQFYSKEMPPESKPEDFRQYFKGNNNDFFCIGIKLTRKAFKLYTSFYSSDIIIASPIGLSMILANPDKKKRQYDFLSSIEVLVIDQANQIEMQNWDHVNVVLKYLNKIPKEFHDADFSRIRMWAINDQSYLMRQNLIFFEYPTPNVNSILGSKSLNLAGKFRFKPIISAKNCMMSTIGLKIKQIFQRYDSSSFVSDPDARFKYFINVTLPSFILSTSYDDGFLIYIPSYFDYVRVKLYMKEHAKVTFTYIDEYSLQAKLTRNRQLFASGKVKVLLYTERLHHFRRFEIKGVKNVLMYGLPSNPIFYKELVRFVASSVFANKADIDLSLIKIMYSKWDAVFLERIVGSERAPVLCNSSNELFEFR